MVMNDDVCHIKLARLPNTSSPIPCNMVGAPVVTRSLAQWAGEVAVCGFAVASLCVLLLTTGGFQLPPMIYSCGGVRRRCACVLVSQLPRLPAEQHKRQSLICSASGSAMAVVSSRLPTQCRVTDCVCCKNAEFVQYSVCWTLFQRLWPTVSAHTPDVCRLLPPTHRHSSAPDEAHLLRGQLTEPAASLGHVHSLALLSCAVLYAGGPDAPRMPQLPAPADHRCQPFLHAVAVGSLTEWGRASVENAFPIQ